MITGNELIEVIKGQQAGRVWQMYFPVSGQWRASVDQSFGELMSLVANGYVIRLAPLPDEITLPARTIPAPLREAPKVGAMVFIATPSHAEFFHSNEWRGLAWELLHLERGLIHSTAERAIAAAKAQVPHES